MAINLPRLTFIVTALFLFSMPSQAVESYKEFKRDRWDFEIGSQYFYSEANYSSSNGSQSLLNGNHYQLLDVNFATRYMPKRNSSIFAWGNIGNAESKDSIATRTNSALSEAAVGFDFLMYSDAFELVPEVIAVIPFEKVDPASDTVLNSEGVLEVRSRLIAQKNYGDWRAYGWLGFNYRGDGRSFLMPWGVGAQLKFGLIRWGAELFGYQSATEDTDKDSILRTAYINGVNAGSMKFYSVNPSLMDSRVYATWLISPKWSVQAEGGMTLTGSNSAAGFHFGGLLRYSFDLTEGYVEERYVPEESPVPNYRSNMYEEPALSSEKKVNQFRETTEDGVDQNLFKPQPTKKPKIVDPQLQKQLDETEFDVELKTNKKKKKRP